MAQQLFHFSGRIERLLRHPQYSTKVGTKPANKVTVNVLSDHRRLNNSREIGAAIEFCITTASHRRLMYKTPLISLAFGVGRFQDQTHHEMKIKVARMGRRNNLRRQRGDVLLEYVILLVCIVLPLVGVNILFNPSVEPPLFNPAGDNTNNFGLFGQAYYKFYNNLVDNISQPIP